MTRESADVAAPWLEIALMAALMLACAVATSKCLADPDLWGHVQYGRDAIRQGLPAGADYTYTAPGHRWINHENISELALAAGVDALGGGGLLMIKTALAVLLFYRLIRRSQRQQLCRAAIYSGVLLTAANLMHFWTLRPQLLTFCWFILLLELLDAEPKPQLSGRLAKWPRTIYLLAPLMLLWANSHGGFVAGLAVALVFFTVRAGHWSWLWWKEADSAPSPTAIWVRYANVWLAMVVATGVNPYGFGLHRWLIESVAQPRPEIVEWSPPELLTVAWAPFWITAAIALVSVACSRRRRDFGELAIMGLVLYEALMHRRHIALFAIVFGYWALPHLDDLLRRLGAGGDERTVDESVSPQYRPAVAAGLIVALATLSGMLFSQIRRIPVRVDGYPVAALQFMADQRLHGKIVSDFKWAQYVLAAFADRPAEQRVLLAFDGRYDTCYPQEIVDMYFDFAFGDDPKKPRNRSAASPAIDAKRILEFGWPDLVLIDRGWKAPTATLQQQSEHWTLLYQDELAQLWGRAARFDDPAGSHYFAPHRRRIGDDPQRGLATWPAFPRFNSPQRQQPAMAPASFVDSTSPLPAF